MISVVIITALLVEYTAALAKLTAGIIPRRQGDSNVVRVGGFVLPCPSPSSTIRSSPIPDFSSHLVDFWSVTTFRDFYFGFCHLFLISSRRVTAEIFPLSVSLCPLFLFVNLYRNIIEILYDFDEFLPFTCVTCFKFLWRQKKKKRKQRD